MKPTLPQIEYDAAAMRRINDERNLQVPAAARPGYEQTLTQGGFAIEKRSNLATQRAQRARP